MKRFLLSFGFMVLAALGVQAQNAFEGLIHYSITYSQDIPGAEGMLPNASENIVSKQRALTRMIGGMQAAMIGDILYDKATDSIFIINHGSEKINTVSASEMEDDNDTPKNKVTKAKEKATIMGYKCRLYEVEITEGDQVMKAKYWITEDFKPATQGKSGATNASGLDLPGFPMKVETELPVPGMDGLFMIMTVTKIQPLAELEENVLSIPASYKRESGLPSLMRMGE